MAGRLPIPSVLALALALIAAGSRTVAATGPEDDLARLRTMTRDERERLARKLAEFDALDPGRREAIRDLDRKLAAAEPETRARYLSVLRRYHVFYRNLPPEKRKALDEVADPAKKLDLIASYREEARRTRPDPRRFDDAVQISALSPLRLRELSRHLFVFFKLDPVKDAKERAELARANDLAKRRALVQSLIQSKHLAALIREEDVEFRAADAKVNRFLEKVENELTRAEAEGARKAKSNSAKAAPRTKEDFEKRRKGVMRKLDEIQVFHDLESQAVASANLDRFEAAMPVWARETIDPLPPDAARRRLKVLYRLVFPPGEEMPVSRSPAPARASKARSPSSNGSARPF